MLSTIANSISVVGRNAKSQDLRARLERFQEDLNRVKSNSRASNDTILSGDVNDIIEARLWLLCQEKLFDPRAATKLLAISDTETEEDGDSDEQLLGTISASTTLPTGVSSPFSDTNLFDEDELSEPFVGCCSVQEHSELDLLKSLDFVDDGDGKLYFDREEIGLLEEELWPEEDQFSALDGELDDTEEVLAI